MKPDDQSATLGLGQGTYPVPRKTHELKFFLITLVAAMPDEEVQSLYYSIGEVSDMIGYEPHVLRYWEKEFDVLNPNKDRAGRRRYTEEDVAMIERIRYLLKDEKYTIAGARQAIQRSEEKEKKRAQISSQLKRLRGFLEELKDEL